MAAEKKKVPGASSKSYECSKAGRSCGSLGFSSSKNKGDDDESTNENSDSDSNGHWKQIGKVYGKGSKGTFEGGNKIMITVFDYRGIALSNGAYFKFTYSQLDSNGKPMFGTYPVYNGAAMKLLPSPVYEVSGQRGKRFDWHLFIKMSEASCDTCGNPGLIMSEFVNE
jgi:hypothetical protein